MLKIIKIINKNIENLLESLQRSNVEEILYLLGSKKEIAKRNFIAGIFRGIGIGIGVTIVSALIIYLLQKIVRWNLPIIGKYIHDIVDIVNGLNSNKY